MSVEPRWEHFAHAADIGIHGVGANPAQAFEQAALALTAVISDPASIAAERAVTLACEAPDIELLLADWLNALIYEMAVRHMLFSRFEVAIVDHRLHGRAWGETVDVVRHRPAVEVKGATYTALEVRCDHNGAWHARCVVDV